MAFLRIEDYYDIISDVNINQILGESTGVSGDPDVLASAEKKSITRAKEYLSHRYKTNVIFREFLDFNIADDYTYNDRINWVADEWESSVYLAGEFVQYLGIVYLRTATTVGYTAATLPTNATFFTNVGEAGIYYIAPPAEYDHDTIYIEDDLLTYSHEIYKKNSTAITATMLPILPTDTAYFTRVRTTEYLSELTVTGAYPSNAAWTLGDNRNQSIVECIAHMTVNKIHSIINPNNIPKQRRENFSMAIAMLKEFQTGDVNVDLPDKEEIKQQGYSLRFGSNEPTEHSY